MKKMFTLRKDELAVTMVAYILIGVIMGTVMDVLASIDVEESNTIPNFVGIMVLVSLAMMGLIMHLIYMKTHFNLAIGMGLTRREFIKQYAVISALFLIGNMVVVYLIALVEHLILSYVPFKVAVYEAIIWDMLLSPAILIYLVMVFAVEMLLAAMTMRWGGKIIWILYGIGMAFMLLGRMFKHEQAPERLQPIVTFFENIGLFGIVGILVLLAVGMMYGAVKLLMKQQVTN